MTLEEIQQRFAERDRDFSQVANRDLAFKRQERILLDFVGAIKEGEVRGVEGMEIAEEILKNIRTYE